MRAFFTISFLLLLTSTTLAQHVHIGYFAQIIRSNNIVKGTGDGYADVGSYDKFGYGIGTSVNLYATNPTSFRIMLGVAQLKQITTFANPGDEELLRGSLSINVPGHVLFGLGNTNFKVVAGVTPSFNFFGGDDGGFNLKAFDFSGDFGLNYKIKGERISILPEIKYSYSFVNAVVENENMYTKAIDKYLRNKFTLTFVFNQEL